MDLKKSLFNSMIYNAYIIRYNRFSSGGIFINSTRESFFLAPPKPSGAGELSQAAAIVGCSNVSFMSFLNFSCSLTVLSPQAFSCSMPPCWYSNARDSPSQIPCSVNCVNKKNNFKTLWLRHVQMLINHPALWAGACTQHACAHGIGIKKKEKGTLVLAINNYPTDSDSSCISRQWLLYSRYTCTCTSR